METRELSFAYEPGSFEAQFHNMERIKTDALQTPVDAVDIIPLHQEGNPVGYFLGWLGQIPGCGPSYEGFYQGNKRVLSVQYPTTRPTKEELPEGFSAYGYRNAQAFVEVAKMKGLEEIDLVGHSEGTGVALMAAQLLEKEGIKVGNIVLVNPSGIKNFSKLEGVKRMGKMYKNEGTYKKDNPELVELTNEADKYPRNAMFRHPINSIREGLDVRHIDMPTLLARVLESGHKVGIIQAANDPFVPYNELGPGVARAQQKERSKRVRRVLSPSPLLTHPMSRSTFDTFIEKLNKQENQNPLIVTIPESVPSGHLFSGFYPENPYYYTPLTVDMLNYFRTGELPNEKKE